MAYMNQLKLILFVVGAMLMSACTTVRTTTESDPVALQQATFWSGMFWVSVAVGTAIAVSAWAIAFGLSEYKKHSSAWNNEVLIRIIQNDLKEIRSDIDAKK